MQRTWVYLISAILALLFVGCDRQKPQPPPIAAAPTATVPTTVTNAAPIAEARPRGVETVSDIRNHPGVDYWVATTALRDCEGVAYRVQSEAKVSLRPAAGLVKITKHENPPAAWLEVDLAGKSADIMGVHSGYWYGEPGEKFSSFPVNPKNAEHLRVNKAFRAEDLLIGDCAWTELGDIVWVGRKQQFTGHVWERPHGDIKTKIVRTRDGLNAYVPRGIELQHVSVPPDLNMMSTPAKEVYIDIHGWPTDPSETWPEQVTVIVTH